MSSQQKQMACGNTVKLNENKDTLICFITSIFYISLNLHSKIPTVPFYPNKTAIPTIQTATRTITVMASPQQQKQMAKWRQKMKAKMAENRVTLGQANWISSCRRCRLPSVWATCGGSRICVTRTAEVSDTIG